MKPCSCSTALKSDVPGFVTDLKVSAHWSLGGDRQRKSKRVEIDLIKVLEVSRAGPQGVCSIITFSSKPSMATSCIAWCDPRHHAESASSSSGQHPSLEAFLKKLFVTESLALCRVSGKVAEDSKSTADSREFTGHALLCVIGAVQAALFVELEGAGNERDSLVNQWKTCVRNATSKGKRTSTGAEAPVKAALPNRSSSDSLASLVQTSDARSASTTASSAAAARKVLLRGPSEEQLRDLRDFHCAPEKAGQPSHSESLAVPLVGYSDESTLFPALHESSVPLCCGQSTLASVDFYVSNHGTDLLPPEASAPAGASGGPKQQQPIEGSSQQSIFRLVTSTDSQKLNLPPPSPSHPLLQQSQSFVATPVKDVARLEPIASSGNAGVVGEGEGLVNESEAVARDVISAVSGGISDEVLREAVSSALVDCLVLRCSNAIACGYRLASKLPADQSRRQKQPTSKASAQTPWMAAAVEALCVAMEKEARKSLDGHHSMPWIVCQLCMVQVFLCAQLYTVLPPKAPSKAVSMLHKHLCDALDRILRISPLLPQEAVELPRLADLATAEGAQVSASSLELAKSKYLSYQSSFTVDTHSSNANIMMSPKTTLVVSNRINVSKHLDLVVSLVKCLHVGEDKHSKLASVLADYDYASRAVDDSPSRSSPESAEKAILQGNVQQARDMQRRSLEVLPKVLGKRSRESQSFLQELDAVFESANMEKEVAGNVGVGAIAGVGGGKVGGPLQRKTSSLTSAKGPVSHRMGMTTQVKQTMVTYHSSQISTSHLAPTQSVRRPQTVSSVLLSPLERSPIPSKHFVAGTPLAPATDTLQGKENVRVTRSALRNLANSSPGQSQGIAWSADMFNSPVKSNLFR